MSDTSSFGAQPRPSQGEAESRDSDKENVTN